MDGKALYEEANKQNIPFYEMTKWIEQRFEKELLDHMYRKNNRKTRPVLPKIPYAVRRILLIYKQDTQSSKLYSQIVIIQNYFKF